MRKVVSNTTPLIALCSVGQLELLRKLYDEIIIPRAVLEEIKSEPARSQIGSCDWISVKEIADTSQKRMYRSKLHSGEVEVMILAQEISADLVIIDDNAAKKTAKYLGLTVTGTIGVLLRAKKDGFINSVKDILTDLIHAGLYISDDIMAYALELADEQ